MQSNLDKRENYLVDKITIFEDSTNFTNTSFIYDNNNLVKRITKGKFVENRQVREKEYIDELEYTNGLVSKIRFRDLTYFMTSHELHLFYNSKKQILRVETWMNNTKIGHQNFHYLDNKMVSIYTDGSKPFEKNTLYYDNSGNLIKQLYRIPKTDLTGNPIPGEFIDWNFIYEYDNKSKPNIGLDYLFIYTPFQNLGTETGYARELSNCNLTKYQNSGTTWSYEYNDVGLPISCEMKWSGIQTLKPMIWNITYKKIN
ncbi:MAG TPA: hypothetical protein VGE25_00100 [Sediminibacterium sp.]